MFACLKIIRSKGTKNGPWTHAPGVSVFPVVLTVRRKSALTRVRMVLESPVDAVHLVPVRFRWDKHYVNKIAYSPCIYGAVMIFVEYENIIVMIS